MPVLQSKTYIKPTIYINFQPEYIFFNPVQIKWFVLFYPINVHSSSVRVHNVYMCIAISLRKYSLGE